MSQKEYSRRQRVAPQLQREIAEVVREEFFDSRLNLLTVTEVQVNKDLSTAKVFISCMGRDPQPAAEFLNQHAGQIRGLVGRRLRMRHAPELKFVTDALPDQAAHLDQLIRGAVAEDRKHHRDDEEQN